MSFDSLWSEIVQHPVWSAVAAGLLVIIIVGAFNRLRQPNKKATGDSIKIENKNQSGGQSIQVGKMDRDGGNEQG